LETRGTHPNTAIKADQSKQLNAPGAGWHGATIAYYFDVRRVCRDCQRPFIFFAEEQQYWYEELALPLEVDCVRCHACRRDQRELERLRKRYNELVATPKPGPAELIELVTLSLDLIDSGAFAAHRARSAAFACGSTNCPISPPTSRRKPN
jgi:hypothetical protein